MFDLFHIIMVCNQVCCIVCVGMMGCLLLGHKLQWSCLSLFGPAVTDVQLFVKGSFKLLR